MSLWSFRTKSRVELQKPGRLLRGTVEYGRRILPPEGRHSSLGSAKMQLPLWELWGEDMP